MKTKIDIFSKLSNSFSDSNKIHSTLSSLFGLFSLSSLLSKLGIEKKKGVPLYCVLIHACMFRILGTSVHRQHQQQYHGLYPHEKNTFYRMYTCSTIDWRKLLLSTAKSFLRLVVAKSDSQTSSSNSNSPTAFIIDDTLLSKTGNHIERISKVFDHVSKQMVLA